MTDAGRVSLPWVKAAPWERGNLFVLNKEFRKKLRRKLNNWASNVVRHWTRTTPIMSRRKSHIFKTVVRTSGDCLILCFCIQSMLHWWGYMRCIDLEGWYPTVCLRYLRPSKFSLSRRNENVRVMKSFSGRIILISLTEITKASRDCSHWGMGLCLFNNSLCYN